MFVADVAVFITLNKAHLKHYDVTVFQAVWRHVESTGAYVVVVRFCLMICLPFWCIFAHTCERACRISPTQLRPAARTRPVPRGETLQFPGQRSWEKPRNNRFREIPSALRTGNYLSITQEFPGTLISGWDPGKHFCCVTVHLRLTLHVRERCHACPVGPIGSFRGLSRLKVSPSHR